MSTIEPAKSSRASCKVCKHKIEIKSARLGIENEFNLNGEIVKSIKWYHIECGAKKFPKEFKNAELNTATITRSGKIELSKEDIDQILEIKSNLNSTGFDILGISKVDEVDKTMNIKASILRVMDIKERENVNGIIELTRSLYIIEKGTRSRLNLRGDLVNINISRDDEIVAFDVITKLGGNDKIQFMTSDKSKLLVNPTINDLEKFKFEPKEFWSDKWERPKNEYCEFVYAPSGRAGCIICDKKINKGELKIIKPIYVTIQRNSREMEVKGNRNYHVFCVLEDEHGYDVIYEALTKIMKDLFHENLSIFEQLLPFVKQNHKVHSLLIEMIE